MLTYNMDVTPESVWKRTTPSEAELAQPYYCTEAGVFYAQQHFSTARTDKESYILFYTLRGAGLIEQGESHVVLSTGQALLLNCRTPQSYCTAPGQSCWHHYWVHLDGAGVAAMEPLLLPGKKLTPVQLTGVKMQEYFEMLLGQMEHSTVDSMVTTGWRCTRCWRCAPGAFLQKLKPPAHGRSFCRQWRPYANITSRNFALPTCWQRHT